MTNRMRVVFVATVVAALAVGAGVALLISNGDDGKSPPATTTSSAISSSSTTTTAQGADTATAVWPVASSSTRYASPTDAARGFAADFLNFVNPVVGEFRLGDPRSGEVDVRSRDAGPATTVLVRQLGPDDSWWVLGSATPNIQVSSPEALARISSPVSLSGMSTAFEATVSVQVREDGNPVPLGEGIVMGGANGTMGPFEGSLAFDPPRQASGSVVFFTVSAEDGSVVEASVLRVHFA